MSRYGKPLQRVTLEYENEIRMLEGEDASKWMDAINDRILFLSKHVGFGEFPKFEWTVTGIDSREERP